MNEQDDCPRVFTVNDLLRYFDMGMDAFNEFDTKDRAMEDCEARAIEEEQERLDKLLTEQK